MAQSSVVLAEPEQATTPRTPSRPAAERTAIARRRAEQVAGFVAAAEAALASDDFDAAIASCEEILVRDPQHEGALACLDGVTAILEERRAAAEREARRLRLEAACAGAASEIDSGAFKAAIARLNEAEERDGRSPELADLRERAETSQREQEHREAVAASVKEQVARAARLLSKSDCQGALACLDTALSLDPSHPAAAGLRLQLLDSLQRLALPVVEQVSVTVARPVVTVDAAPATEDTPLQTPATPANPVEVGDALSLFASEGTASKPAQVRSRQPQFQSRAVTPVRIQAAPGAMSLRLSGRALSVCLAALAAAPAAGLVSYWYVGRAPVLPVVAAAALETAAPAPVVPVGDVAPVSSIPEAAVELTRTTSASAIAPAKTALPAPRATAPQADSRASGATVRAAAATPTVAAPSDEQGVHSALQTYASAYAALDVDAVKRVFPTANESTLRQSFSGLASQRLEIRDEQMAVAGDIATVSCTLVTSAVATDASVAPPRDSRRTVFNLAKRNGAWVIVDRR